MTATIVALHGFARSPSSFAPLRSIAPLFAPNLFGHGAEIPRRQAHAATFLGTVDALAALIEDQTVGPRVLCGYSLGGRLALALIVRHTHLFSRALIIGAHHGLATEKQRTARRKADRLWIDLLEGEGIDSFSEKWTAQPLFQARNTRSALAGLRAEHHAQIPHGLAQALAVLGLAEMPYLLPELAEVVLPTTLMAGARDSKFAKIAQRIASAMPRGSSVIVEDSGHDVLMEQPSAVMRALAHLVEDAAGLASDAAPSSLGVDQ